jgi:hypothetical protein
MIRKCLVEAFNVALTPPSVEVASFSPCPRLQQEVRALIDTHKVVLASITTEGDATSSDLLINKLCASFDTAVRENRKLPSPGYSLYVQLVNCGDKDDDNAILHDWVQHWEDFCDAVDPLGRRTDYKESVRFASALDNTAFGHLTRPVYLFPRGCYISFPNVLKRFCEAIPLKELRDNIIHSIGPSPTSLIFSGEVRTALSTIAEMQHNHIQQKIAYVSAATAATVLRRLTRSRTGCRTILMGLHKAVDVPADATRAETLVIMRKAARDCVYFIWKELMVPKELEAEHKKLVCNEYILQQSRGQLRYPTSAWFQLFRLVLTWCGYGLGAVNMRVAGGNLLKSVHAEIISSFSNEFETMCAPSSWPPKYCRAVFRLLVGYAIFTTFRQFNRVNSVKHAASTSATFRQMLAAVSGKSQTKTPSGDSEATSNVATSVFAGVVESAHRGRRRSKPVTAPSAAAPLARTSSDGDTSAYSSDESEGDSDDDDDDAVVAEFDPEGTDGDVMDEFALVDQLEDSPDDDIDVDEAYVENGVSCVIM